MLLEFGADINARDTIFAATPLTWAVLCDSREMVEFLMECGAATNLPDDQEWNTPMFWAQYLGHQSIIKSLSN